MTHSSLELLTPPYLNTRKASPHPAQCWWRERQNRGAYNTSTDERQSNGEGLEREQERAREKEKERLIKNVLLGCAEGPWSRIQLSPAFFSAPLHQYFITKEASTEFHTLKQDRVSSPAVQLPVQLQSLDVCLRLPHLKEPLTAAIHFWVFEDHKCWHFI